MRKFFTGKDRSFTQWKTEAENLIIRIFGESSNQYLQFKGAVRWYESHEPDKPTQSDNAAYYRMIETGYTKEAIEKMIDAEWDKLLKEKGVLKQLDKEHKTAVEEYVENLDAHTTLFKEKMRDAFTAWINEVELFSPTIEQTPQKQRGSMRINNLSS